MILKLFILAAAGLITVSGLWVLLDIVLRQANRSLKSGERNNHNTADEVV